MKMMAKLAGAVALAAMFAAAPEAWAVKKGWVRAEGSPAPERREVPRVSAEAPKEACVRPAEHPNGGSAEVGNED